MFGWEAKIMRSLYSCIGYSVNTSNCALHDIQRSISLVSSSSLPWRTHDTFRQPDAAQHAATAATGGQRGPTAALSPSVDRRLERPVLPSPQRCPLGSGFSWAARGAPNGLRRICRWRPGVGDRTGGRGRRARRRMVAGPRCLDWGK